MDILSVVNSNRLRNGYIDKRYKEYKGYNNTKYRQLLEKDPSTALFHKLESNYSKYKLFKSSRYIRKNLRLLKNKNTENALAYRKYMELILKSLKNDVTAGDILEVRPLLVNYGVFLEDIYMLGDDGYSFDSEKIPFEWNDIQILFESESEKNAFLDGRLEKKDGRFNTRLARFIWNLENSKKAFENALETEKIENTYHVSKKLLEDSKKLLIFIDENFIDSNYVRSLDSSIKTVHRIVYDVYRKSNGENVSIDKKSFQVPEIFKKYKEVFEKLMSSDFITPKKFKLKLISELEGCILKENRPARIPLFPVFYDIAYDFIKYPDIPDQ